MKPLVSKITIFFSVVFLLGFSSCYHEDFIVCDDAEVQIVNNTDYFVCYSLDPSDDYCYSNNYIAPGESMVVSYGEIYTSVDDPHYLDFFYRFGGQGYADYAMSIEIENCYNTVFLQ